MNRTVQNIVVFLTVLILCAATLGACAQNGPGDTGSQNYCFNVKINQ
jgi:hypothetical protein